MADHHVLLYTYVPDMAERRGPHREPHLARIRSAHASGRLIMAGAIGERASGGLLVWRDVDPEEIEAWVAEDPYYQAGLITEHRVEPWSLVVAPDAG